MIDPVTGALIGSAVNGIGSFISNKTSVADQKKLAKYTNQLQMDSWNSQFAKMNARQDQLNAMSASVMKNSLANAGLSASGDNNFAEFSSSPAQGNGTSPTLGNSSPINFGDFQGAVAQTRLADAQAKLAEAQADKTKKETSWIDRINEAGVGFTKAQMDEIEKMTPVNREKVIAETDKISKETDKIGEDILYVRKMTDSVDADIVRKDIENLFANDKCSYELSLLKKELQIKDMSFSQMRAQLANLFLTGESIRLGNANLRLQNDKLEFEFTDEQDFNNVNRALQIYSTVMGSLNSLSSLAGQMVYDSQVRPMMEGMQGNYDWYKKNRRKKKK